MEKYLVLKEMFEKSQDPENAVAMSKYMKSKFEFYGLATPQRKNLYKDFLKSEKSIKTIDWAFLDKCYEDNHREFQYLVYDYLLSMKKFLVFEDIVKIEKYIKTKSWWDTIDFLCKSIGEIGLNDLRVGDLMLNWSKDENIWIKRTSILHQLSYKNKTNTDLLGEILLNCLGSEEFFVNKAIGWALREYSKTNPQWVSVFIGSNKDRLSSLTLKEASKYLL